jgi:hypothetical protein
MMDKFVIIIYIKDMSACLRDKQISIRGPGVSIAPGRNAAQVIFADLNLDFSDSVIS